MRKVSRGNRRGGERGENLWLRGGCFLVLGLGR
jgi:hypothetical protein